MSEVVDAESSPDVIPPDLASIQLPVILEDKAIPPGLSSLPRTSQLTYNVLDPSQKYFLYSPSGGFSNQRAEIENAMMIGKILNRTVIIPEIGKHAQMWWCGK